jgi:predicted DNA-binding transcriptional regulator YafY
VADSYRQRFTPLKHGCFTMQVPLSNVHEFIPWVLQFGGDAEVLEPESVREDVKNAIVRSLAQYK